MAAQSDQFSPAIASELLCSWTVPGLADDDARVIEAYPTRTTVIVGANGSGKSALGLWLQQTSQGAVVRRIVAHRRLWLEHAGPDITAAQRESVGPNLINWSMQDDSRWLDHANVQRAGIVLFDLLSKVNERNARVAGMVDQGATSDEIRAKVESSLLGRLNRILRLSLLKVTIELTDKASLDAVQVDAQLRYPISQMSDGEKSALLLAAEVMTAPPASVLIVDEPERHLHRSISAGLIEAVAEERPDCHFVVLTHDLDLAASLPGGSTTLAVLTGCRWSGARVLGWDLHFVDGASSLPEATRRGILGGRKKVIFLEGQSHSLDLRLLTILFPGWTLMPTGGCEQVIRAVKGLHASRDHHWIQAHGVVDGDGRSDAEREALAAGGILALPVNEIESLYYSAEVVAAVATAQALMLEKVPDELIALANSCALAAIQRDGTPQRLAAAVAEGVVRRAAVDLLPSRDALQDGTEEQIQLFVPSPYMKLLNRINDLLARSDLEGIVRDFPVRDSSLRIEVAKSLGFRTSDDYEAAARTRIASDRFVLTKLRELVGDLPSPSTGMGAGE